MEFGNEAAGRSTGTVSIRAAGWDPHDERLLAEAEPLFNELEAAGLTVPVAAEPGSKGMAETLETAVVALGSAGAIAAFRDISLEWIKARTNMSIKINFESTGKEVEITGPMANDPRVWELLNEQNDQ
ncbi:effector-associated constant component EACC1 [Actinoplanes cyaneus]|uniref:effector-associated constant component EACC1 n=1 Tax=Actinoplanes cyaneus TaxID=52696 RepID=UPI001942199A|nr:hypothetical protein [Actinoplanes cyaneus]MCW2141021.1 hypothetical protein [Actinoplanes cyaneus]